MSEKSAFEENLRKRGATLRNELEKEVSLFVTNLVKNKYQEIYVGNFPSMRLYGTSGSSYEPTRVDAHFEASKETDQKFEEIAMKRFESSLENLRWVFENQGQT